MSYYTITNHLPAYFNFSLKLESVRGIVASCLKTAYLLLAAVMSVVTVPLLFWAILR